MKTPLLRLERHTLGPRVHLLGRRVHEYHVGLAVLALSPAVSSEGALLSPGSVIGAIAGFWLVAKDWPDLFAATRDRASWRFGLHRLPPGERPPLASLLRDTLGRTVRARQ